MQTVELNCLHPVFPLLFLQCLFVSQCLSRCKKGGRNGGNKEGRGGRKKEGEKERKKGGEEKTNPAESIPGAVPPAAT